MITAAGPREIPGEGHSVTGTGESRQRAGSVALVAQAGTPLQNEERSALLCPGPPPPATDDKAARRLTSLSPQDKLRVPPRAMESPGTTSTRVFLGSPPPGL